MNSVVAVRLLLWVDLAFLHDKQEQIFSIYLITNTFVSTKQMVFSKKALSDHLKTPCFFFFFLNTKPP